ncbi:hypothetical protein BASA81_013883 [Batrachochytrium salamandrivorans]|nr:hypothetical protein BASA81_013883 [Batrachochytrium salamandrivorans]
MAQERIPRGFINQLELRLSASSESIRHGSKKDRYARNFIKWKRSVMESFARHLAKLIRNKSPRQDFVLSDKEISLVQSMFAEFRQLTADIDWNDAALRSQFYHGLSREIKMLWYTSTTLLQSQQLWIWQFESITGYLKTPGTTTIPSETLFE